MEQKWIICIVPLIFLVCAGIVIETVRGLLASKRIQKVQKLSDADKKVIWITGQTGFRKWMQIMHDNERILHEVSRRKTTCYTKTRKRRMIL